MKLLLTTILLFFNGCMIFSQSIYDYTFYYKQDTFNIELTEEEKLISKHKIYLELQNIKKPKKKSKLKERIKAEILLHSSDTLYYANIVDYFDSYMIAFLLPVIETEDTTIYFDPIGYKRIFYSDFNWIETNGKRKSGYRFLAGFTVGLLGLELVIFPLIDSETFSPLMIPIGLPLIYLGGKILDGIAWKKYNQTEWEINVINKTTR